MKDKIDNHPADKYFFTMIPDPINETQRISSNAKRIWAIIYSYQKRNFSNLTVSKIARKLGSIDLRNSVRRSLESLEKEGLVYLTRIKVNAKHKTEIAKFKALWPDWLENEAKQFPQRDEKKSKDHEVVKNLPPPGKKSTTPWSKNYQETGQKLTTLESKDLLREFLKDDVAEQVQLEENDPTDDELELNHDGDSVELKKVYDNKEKRKPVIKKLKRKPSGSEFENTPSLRWEFKKHKSKPINTWGGRDLVGYWVTRYVELLGVEDEEFHVSDVLQKFIMRNCKNSATTVNKHLGGDWTIAKNVVDAIFERAKERGIPAEFVYFFTPSKPEAIFNILKKSGGKKQKKKSLSEINNNLGKSEEDWKDDVKNGNKLVDEMLSKFG